MVKKTNRTKLIKKHFGEAVGEFGFEYAGASAWTWDFHRQKGTAMQEIIIMRHRYFPDQIKLLFHAGGYGWGDQEPRNFIESYQYKEYMIIMLYWWKVCAESMIFIRQVLRA